ncbi:CLIPassociating proteinlike [Caligus rogercresseyi]|uniref:CLIPassociating proteinlike n=1 Tax=Caligus rogercresseyi TaxID=217165 RepID=A0A7T8K9I8_CALRO|nr:CLIPassociating proteinlike [Caligus rogercresseyi]
MDEFMLQLRTGDAKKKLTLGSDILSYLEEPENSIECEDLGGFIDAVTSWMTSSNFKVSQNGLDIMAHLVDRLGSGFKLYVNSIIGPATDRLGDSRGKRPGKGQSPLYEAHG